MIIILPNEMNGITKVESGLTSKVLEEMEKITSKEKLCVELPKFAIRHQGRKELKDALREIGIRDLFENGVADLSGVSESTGPQRVFLSSIRQKCYDIKVNVKGTETAQATKRNTN